MILKHPHGVIILTFELVANDFNGSELDRILVEALVAPPDLIDSMVQSLVQTELDRHARSFFEQLARGLDPSLKPLLRQSLMNHPFLQSTFSEYVLEQSLILPETGAPSLSSKPRL